MADAHQVLAGPVPEVALALLGGELRHGEVALRITEVEAYGGADDPGSHAYRGRTRRNAVMFGPAGRLYCYFTYGMHVCANVVTGAEGAPEAVLLRAGDGLDLARSRRPGVRDRDLARGPARLCRALGIGLDLDGADLLARRTPTGPVGPVLTLRASLEPPPQVTAGPRVGLRGAPDRPWRFWVTADPTVSPYRPAAPRRPS